MVEEFQSQIREEDDKFVASEVNLGDLPSQPEARSGSDDVMLLTPSGKGLIDHAAEHTYSRRELERCLLKHTTNHDFLSTQLAVKLLELNEVGRKHDFHESNHRILSVHIFSLKGMRAKFAYSSPHPIPYPIELCVDSSFDIAVGYCKKCLIAFQFRDIIVASCLHCYHPWCTLLHFREANTCAKPGCTVTVSPEWCKSFGFQAFGVEISDLEVALGCEDARIQNLANRRDQALLHCPNVGKHIFPYQGF
jgi:hypothetical protein